MSAFLVPVIIAVFCFMILFYIFGRRRQPSLNGKHVVITGGSSGIGKCVAKEVATLGANITLIARDVAKLEVAVKEVSKHCVHPEEQRVQFFSLDLSENYETVEQTLLTAEEQLGSIYMLVNCAGMAICGRVEDTSVKDIKYLMNLNFLGTVYPTKAVIPRMKSHREGKIIIVGSQGGLLGIYGFAVYSSTKFALRGFAEALHMEMKPYNVSVTLALPPDTDTPGFANEEKTKPLETKLISQSAGLVAPEVVAKQMLKDVFAGSFYSTVGMESFILKTLCAGMTPVSSLTELLTQVLLMGPLRLISVFYLFKFHRIIHNCMKRRDKTKKSE